MSGLTPGVGPVSSAIVRVGRLHRMLAGQLLRRVGLHPAQEIVLMQLWDAGPQRISDLAATLGADVATTTRTVNRLEKSGFVRRVPSRTDRRVTIVESTEAGNALRGDVERIWDELEQAVTAGIDESELAAVVATLGRMEAGLTGAIDAYADRADRATERSL